jgi:uridine kinase
MDSIYELFEKIIDKNRRHLSGGAFTVAISGIDASGKGYISKLLQEKLESDGLNVANINIDPWQNPLPIRLQKENAAQNVYDNIFRWNDFFKQLIFPLQKNKSIYLETQGIHTHADEYYPLIYDFKDIDILLIEGIFLFKKQYLSGYDYKIWIECSFEKGLQRAISRNAENLDEESLIHDYRTYYFAAQELHFKKDNPQISADMVFENN